MSSDAWDRLVRDYRDLCETGQDTNARTAELLRTAIGDTEGYTDYLKEEIDA